MGRITNLNFLGFHGTFGEIIIYQLNGEWYYRKKPASIPKEFSDKQIEHQERFGAFHKFAKVAMDKTNKKIWEKKSRKLSGYDYFVKTNMRYFDKSEEFCEFEKLRFSVGDHSLPDDMIIENSDQSKREYIIRWDEKTDIVDIDLNSSLRIIALKNDFQVEFISVKATLADGAATFQLPWKDEKIIHLYAYFFSKNYSGTNMTYYQKIINQ
jgi:hypothetical protein